MSSSGSEGNGGGGPRRSARFCGMMRHMSRIPTLSLIAAVAIAGCGGRSAQHLRVAGCPGLIRDWASAQRPSGPNGGASLLQAHTDMAKVLVEQERKYGKQTGSLWGAMTDMDAIQLPFSQGVTSGKAADGHPIHTDVAQIGGAIHSACG